MRPWNDHPKTGGLCYRARVEPSQIAYLCAITEAHEGLAIIRTKDEALGIVEFWISPLMQRDFEDFLQAFGQEISINVGPPMPLNVQELDQ